MSVGVTIENVTKIFGKRVIALNNVNIKIRPGEFFALLGPSGSGKTTLLRCVAGLERPDKGRIIIGDKVVYDAEKRIFIPPKDRDVAMVFQNYALYPHMKVFDNIAFPLKIRKYPMSEIKKRVHEVAMLLRIDDLLDRYPRQLSGGQQQRVALARALVRNPKVFLMDEPLSNLDAKLRVYMRAELKKLQKDLKITTIYVTHDQVEAMTMADRIAVINEGRVQQIGTPDELYHKPSNIFVAGFIGSPPMNFFDSVIKIEEDKVIIDVHDFKLTLPADYKPLLERYDGKDVILGIRPEHFLVASKEEENTIKAEVYVTEPLGAETILNLKVGSKIFKVKAPPYLKVNIGDKIIVKPLMDKIHLFDAATEKVIL